jgi:hypothetical protein
MFLFAVPAALLILRLADPAALLMPERVVVTDLLIRVAPDPASLVTDLFIRVTPDPGCAVVTDLFIRVTPDPGCVVTDLLIRVTRDPGCAADELGTLCPAVPGRAPVLCPNTAGIASAKRSAVLRIKENSLQAAVTLLLLRSTRYNHPIPMLAARVML